MARHNTFEHWLQSRLTAHGFPVGAIDGIVGPITRAALKQFERRHGLPVNGTADPKVVELLRKSATEHVERIPERDEVKSSPWPAQADVPSFYGTVGLNQSRLELPFDMYLAWDKSYRVSRITVHKLVHNSAERVFQKIAQTYSAAERADLGLNLFGGSLNVRRMRGGSQYSMHSWGIAIDFDPERNQLTWKAPKPRLSHEDAFPFWEAWEDEGWVSLGRERDFDWMHVQAARLR